MFVVCLVGVWQRTLPNTDQAHDKHQWTTTNFSQAQLCTPWWWITYDPKHVGVIFNLTSFKLYTTWILTSKFCIIKRIWSANKSDW